MSVLRTQRASDLDAEWAVKERRRAAAAADDDRQPSVGVSRSRRRRRRRRRTQEGAPAGDPHGRAEHREDAAADHPAIPIATNAMPLAASAGAASPSAVGLVTWPSAATLARAGAGRLEVDDRTRDNAGGQGRGDLLGTAARGSFRDAALLLPDAGYRRSPAAAPLLLLLRGGLAGCRTMRHGVSHWSRSRSLALDRRCSSTSILRDRRRGAVARASMQWPSPQRGGTTGPDDPESPTWQPAGGCFVCRYGRPCSPRHQRSRPSLAGLCSAVEMPGPRRKRAVGHGVAARPVPWSLSAWPRGRGRVAVCLRPESTGSGFTTTCAARERRSPAFMALAVPRSSGVTRSRSWRGLDA